MDKAVGLNTVSQQSILHVSETQQHAFLGSGPSLQTNTEKPRIADGQILELSRAIEDAKAAGPPGSPIFRDFSPTDGTVKQLVAQLEATFHSAEVASLAFNSHAGFDDSISPTTRQLSSAHVTSFASPTQASASQADTAGSDGDTTSTFPTSHGTDIATAGSAPTSAVLQADCPSTDLSPTEHCWSAGADSTDPKKRPSRASLATSRLDKNHSITAASYPHSTIRKAKSVSTLRSTPLQSLSKDGTSPREAPSGGPSSPTKSLSRQSKAPLLHTAQRAAERRTSPTKETSPQKDVWPVYRCAAAPPVQTIRKSNKESPTKTTETVPKSLTDLFRKEAQDATDTPPQRVSKSPTRRLADMAKTRSNASSVSSPTDAEFVSAHQTPSGGSPVSSNRSFVTATEGQRTPKRKLEEDTQGSVRGLPVHSASKSTVSPKKAARPKLSITIPSAQQLRTQMGKAASGAKTSSPMSSSRTSKLPVRVRAQTLSAADPVKIQTTPALLSAPALAETPENNRSLLEAQSKGVSHGIERKEADNVLIPEDFPAHDSTEEPSRQQRPEPENKTAQDEDDEPNEATLAILKELSLTASQGTPVTAVRMPPTDEEALKEVEDHPLAVNDAAHSPWQEDPAVIVAGAKVGTSPHSSKSATASSNTSPVLHDPAIILSVARVSPTSSKGGAVASPSAAEELLGHENARKDSMFPAFQSREGIVHISPKSVSSAKATATEHDPAIIYSGRKPRTDSVTSPLGRNRSASLWSSTSPTRARDPHQQTEDHFPPEVGAYSPRSSSPKPAGTSPQPADALRSREDGVFSPRSTITTELRADAPDFVPSTFKRPSLPTEWMDPLALPPSMASAPDFRFIPLGEPLMMPTQTLTKSQRKALRQKQRRTELAAYGPMSPTYGGSAGFFSMPLSFGGFGTMSSLPLQTCDEDASPQNQPAKPQRYDDSKATTGSLGFWNTFKNAFRGPSSATPPPTRAASPLPHQPATPPSQQENASPKKHSGVPIFRREEAFVGNALPPAALPTAAPGSPPKVNRPPVIGQFERWAPRRAPSPKKYVGYGLQVPPCGCYEVETACEWVGGVCHKCWPNGV